MAPGGDGNFKVIWRPEGAIDLRGQMVDAAPGGRNRPQRSNGRCGARRAQSTSEVEWSMRRPEGAIDLRGGMVDAAPGGAQSTSEVESF